MIISPVNTNHSDGGSVTISVTNNIYSGIDKYRDIKRSHFIFVLCPTKHITAKKEMLKSVINQKSSSPFVCLGLITLSINITKKNKIQTMFTL